MISIWFFAGWRIKYGWLLWKVALSRYQLSSQTIGKFPWHTHLIMRRSDNWNNDLEDKLRWVYSTAKTVIQKSKVWSSNPNLSGNEREPLEHLKRKPLVCLPSKCIKGRILFTLFARIHSLNWVLNISIRRSRNINVLIMRVSIRTSCAMGCNWRNIMYFT